MGQYQARSKSVDEDVPVSTDVDEATQSSSVVTDVPPIFGSPIHSKLILDIKLIDIVMALETVKK